MNRNIISKIIAGGAIGVFAVVSAAGNILAEGVSSGDGSYIDTLSVTVAKGCTFERGQPNDVDTKHSDSAGTWDDDVLSLTAENGHKYNNVGYSYFVVTCNNAGGYQVTTETSNFVKLSETDDGSWMYVPLGTGASDDDSYWYLTTDARGADLGNGVVSKVQGTVYKEPIDIAYHVNVSQVQSAGTYEATAVYTFAQLESSGGDVDMAKNVEPTPKKEEEPTKNPDDVKKEEEKEPEVPGENTDPVEGENKDEDKVFSMGNPAIVTQTPVNITNNYITYKTENEGETQQVTPSVTTKSSDVQKSTEGKQDALGVVSSNGEKTAKTLATVGEPEDNHSGLIVALCAAGVAATAAAGAYLYNKGKEEE